MNTEISFVDATKAEAQFGDGACFGWRYAAISRPKQEHGVEPGPNDDHWLTRRGGKSHWYAAVIDVATNKVGIDGIDIQSAIQKGFARANANASPAEIVAAAHAAVARELARKRARGVACFMVARLGQNGECLWAHVGDAVILRYQPQTWWRRSRLRLLNSRHRRGQGLTESVGMTAPRGPRIEEGAFMAAPGERVLLCSDGVHHDEMTLTQIKRWIDAYDRRGDELMASDLAQKIEAEARYTQPHADDTTIVVLERSR
jgi:serine/threonine protein phosphatase PrpC